MFKIEKNIPLPTNIRRAGRKGKYPFGLLKAGDSFLVPEGKMKTISVSLANHNKKMKPKQFTARTVKDGIRVWRVK